MKFSELGPQAISRVGCWSFIIAMCMRNRTLRIPPTEDGLSLTLLISKYLGVLSSPFGPYKLNILIILGALWMYRAIGDMLSIIVSNSHFWKRLGARDVTIFGYHVGSHILNSGYLEAYGSIWRYMGVFGSI